MRTGNEVMGGKVRRNYEGKKTKKNGGTRSKDDRKWRDSKGLLEIRSKMNFRKKRFKGGKRNFRKLQTQNCWKSFCLLRYAATVLDTKELGQDGSIRKNTKQFFFQGSVVCLSLCTYVSVHLCIYHLLVGDELKAHFFFYYTNCCQETGCKCPLPINASGLIHPLFSGSAKLPTSCVTLQKQLWSSSLSYPPLLWSSYGIWLEKQCNVASLLLTFQCLALK